MFINVTEKSRVLFRALPEVADKQQAHAVAAAAPLWSWHANAMTWRRKKILVLVQDATGITVVLGDINANRKKELATLIRDGIQQTFAAVGVDATPYLAQAGTLQVNSTYSRSVMGVVNNRITLFTYALEKQSVDWSPSIGLELSKWGSETPYTSAKKALPTWPIEALKQAAANGFQA